MHCIHYTLTWLSSTQQSIASVILFTCEYSDVKQHELCVTTVTLACLGECLYRLFTHTNCHKHGGKFLQRNIIHNIVSPCREVDPISEVK